MVRLTRCLFLRAEGCSPPVAADTPRLPYRSNAACVSILPSLVVRGPQKYYASQAPVPWPLSHLTLTDLFDRRISRTRGRPPVAEGLCNLLRDLLTFIDQSTSVVRGHLHPLRDTFRIGFKGFRDGFGPA